MTTSIKSQIVRGMARAFFATAWADMVEEGAGMALAGKEIMEVMPRTLDPAALHAAATLAMAMERANRTASGNRRPLKALYQANKGTPELSPREWGHYAAMESMGHGVGLWEYEIDTERLPGGPGLVVPYVEFSQCSLDKDYTYPPTRKA